MTLKNSSQSKIKYSVQDIFKGDLNQRILQLFYSDITKGKEANPIQCVNGFDGEPKPNDFIYITENCFTSPLHVDRTINSLTVLLKLQLLNRKIS